MAYSLDTSALIEAWVRYYPPDVFPTLWEHFESGISNERFIAVDEVLVELSRKEDDLHNWAKEHRELFVPLEEPIQICAIQIINNYPSLTDVNGTRGAADPFVIALAAERKLTVVTAEQSKPTQPRIPDVCRDMGISCISLVELFRNEGWSV